MQPPILFATLLTRYDLAIIICVIFFVAWMPSHYFFKWLQKHYGSQDILIASIIVCTVITLALLEMGIKFGNHVGQPAESLWSSGAGGVSGVNLMWLPFMLFAGGIWGGFLSGYLKVPIDK